jgi:hypothetical protein
MESGPVCQRQRRRAAGAGRARRGNPKLQGAVSSQREVCYFPFSLFPFPLSASPYAAGTAKRRERKYQHRDGIDDRKTQEPCCRASVPLSPRGDRAVKREHAEYRPGGLVKKLARGAPHYAQRDFCRVPERRIKARGHTTILVHNAPGRCRVWQLFMLLIVFDARNLSVRSGNWRGSPWTPGSCFGLARALRLV